MKLWLRSQELGAARYRLVPSAMPPAAEDSTRPPMPPFLMNAPFAWWMCRVNKSGTCRSGYPPYGLGRPSCFIGPPTITDRHTDAMAYLLYPMASAWPSTQCECGLSDWPTSWFWGRPTKGLSSTTLQGADFWSGRRRIKELAQWPAKFRTPTSSSAAHLLLGQWHSQSSPPSSLPSRLSRSPTVSPLAKPLGCPQTLISIFIPLHRCPDSPGYLRRRQRDVRRGMLRALPGHSRPPG